MKTKQEIWPEVAKLRKLSLELDEKGSALETDVAEIFNKFVVEEINPKLPKGFELLEGQAKFETRYSGMIGFRILPGAVKTPHGTVSHGPFGFEDTIRRLCQDYKEKNIWVTEIDYKFCLSE